MANEPAELGATAIGELTSDRLLVLRLPQTNLHELVIQERTIDRAEHPLAEPTLPDLDERLAGVRETAKETALKALKGRHGSETSYSSGPRA
jgi:hypothetical protein